jgi:hypothetical protein
MNQTERGARIERLNTRMTTKEQVDGMVFRQADDGHGFCEIRIRMPNSGHPGAFSGTCVGNEARKKLIRWVLATAGGMCPAIDQAALYERAQVLLRAVESEYESFEAIAERTV